MLAVPCKHHRPGGHCLEGTISGLVPRLGSACPTSAASQLSTQPSPLARTSLNEALKDTGNSLRFRKNLCPADTTPAPSSPGPASRKPSCREPCEGELRATEDGMPKSHHIRLSNILRGASQPCSHRRKPAAHGLLSCPACSSHRQDLCTGHALGWVTDALLSWMQWACSFPFLGSPLPWLIIPWNAFGLETGLVPQMYQL